MLLPVVKSDHTLLTAQSPPVASHLSSWPKRPCVIWFPSISLTSSPVTFWLAHSVLGTLASALPSNTSNMFPPQLSTCCSFCLERTFLNYVWALIFSSFRSLFRCFLIKAPVAQMVKNLPAIQETQVWSLGQEDPLEKEMATDSSILLLFSRSVMSNSLRPHELQHARLPCPSPSAACSNSCPLSRWCHLTISSSIVPFSSCLQSFPASRSFLMSQLLHTTLKNWAYFVCCFPSALFLKRGGLVELQWENNLINLLSAQVFLLENKVVTLQILVW